MKFNHSSPHSSGIYMRRVFGNDGDDTLLGSRRSDSIYGRAGNDKILDIGGGQKDDAFFGGAGNDVIHTRWGKDFAFGGAGDDMIVSRSDGGEPLVAQDASISPFNAGQPFSGRVSNDHLSGGKGADTFMFRLDLNARPDIAAKHIDDDGTIDWEGVAGENGAAHLHWVETIGTDTIRDFSKAQGDMIKIEGHTAAIDITYADKNRDGIEESIIKIRSDQGGAGSHNGDSIGTIVVYGDRVEVGDVAVDAGVHHGAYANINDMMIA